MEIIVNTKIKAVMALLKEGVLSRALSHKLFYFSFLSVLMFFVVDF